MLLKLEFCMQNFVISGIVQVRAPEREMRLINIFIAKTMKILCER